MWGYARVMLMGLVHTEPKVVWIQRKDTKQEMCIWKGTIVIPWGYRGSARRSYMTLKGLGRMGERMSTLDIKKGERLAVFGDLTNRAKAPQAITWSAEVEVTDFTLFRERGRIADRMRGKVMLDENEYRRLKALTAEVEDYEIPPDVLESIELPKTPWEEARDGDGSLGYHSVSLTDLLWEAQRDEHRELRGPSSDPD